MYLFKSHFHCIQKHKYFIDFPIGVDQSNLKMMMMMMLKAFSGR